jgi:WD40 repeat protein/tRNA A-37 threonylcarbamoyl transferase component Bud32
MTRSTCESQIREDRVHGLIADYLDREAAGQAPERTAWLEHHADVAQELREFLDEHARIGRLGSPLRALALPGSDAATIGGSTADTGEAPAVVRYFGDYELLAEIARGGMGVVFKARQRSLNRLVALKMILAGQLATSTEVERFQIEARAAGNLDHPHIVPIYEVGQHDGQHYFSMKLIDGDNLAAAIAADRWLRRSRIGQRGIARLLVQAARGVQYAHQRGILHRDLKPGNILLDRDGVPHVTDFGLAKRVGGESALTHTGAVVGTPSYMAPEQAAGNKQLTTAADAYSLGAILYEMLAGQPPFRGATPLDVMMQVADREPPPPRSHNADLAPDLQTICLKCLEKDPARRYASAEAFADDLERWLTGEPIHARSATSWERTTKWIKRRPAVAALLGVSIVSAAALLIGGLVFNAELQVALGQVKTQQKALDHARGAVANAQAAVAKEQKDAEDANTLAKALLAEAASLRLVARSESVRSTDPGLAMLLAIEAAQRAPRRSSDHNNALVAALNACREIGPLIKTNREHVSSVRFLVGGQRLLTISWSTVRIWDVKTGRKLVEIDGPRLNVHGFALSPDHKRLALLFDRQFEYSVIEIRGQTIRKPFLVTDQAVRIYDTETGAEVQVLRGHQDRVSSVVFSSDGKRILTASLDRTARIWDAETGKPLRVLDKGHACSLASAEFMPDGLVLTVSSGVKRHRDENPLQALLQNYPAESVDPPITEPFRVLAGGSSSSRGSGYPQGEALFACVWNAETGDRVSDVRTARRNHHFPIAGKVTRDGKRLVGTTGGGPVVWDLQTGKEIHAFNVNEETLPGTQLSGDGKRALTCHNSRNVHVWDLVGSKESAVLRGHTDVIRSARFSPDPEGRFVLTTSEDKTARLWDTATGKELMSLKGHELDVLDADFTGDGLRAATGSADGTARFWNLAPHNDCARLVDEAVQTWWIAATPSTPYVQRIQRAIWSAVLSPDGRRVAAGYYDGTLRLFDIASGNMVASQRGSSKLDPKYRDAVLREIFEIVYSDDGKRFLTLSADAIERTVRAELAAKPSFPSAPVRVHDAATGLELAAFGGEQGSIRFARFSPDGTRVLTVADNLMNTVMVNKDGRLIGSGGGGRIGKDTTARIWDAATGQLLQLVRGDWKEICSASWDPKGQRIAIVHEDSTVKIYDAQTGLQLLEITDRVPGPDCSRFTAADFSPDGRRLLTWYDDQIRPTYGYGRPRQARAWDLATGKLLFAMKDSEGFAAYSPDGRWIVTTGYNPNGHTMGGEYGLHGRPRDHVFANRAARIWDAETGTLYAVLNGHDRSVCHASFSKDGRWLVTASEDHTACLWNLEAGKQAEVITLRGHQDGIKTAQLSPDGKTVLTVAWDGTARLWPVDPLPLALERKPRELTIDERAKYDIAPRP